MNIAISSVFRAGLICLLFAFYVAVLPASAQAPAAEQEIVRVRRLEAFGPRAKIQTPDFQARGRGIQRSATPPGEWHMITVDYDAMPDWTDELTFRYFVVTRIMRDGAPAFSFFRHVVRYGDIERGRSKQSTVFLRPVTIKRYGEPIGVAYEIMFEGNVVASGSQEAADFRVPENWWNNRQVTELLTERQGYLLDRSQTPFALVNIDDYEVIR